MRTPHKQLITTRRHWRDQGRVIVLDARTTKARHVQVVYVNELLYQP